MNNTVTLKTFKWVAWTAHFFVAALITLLISIHSSLPVLLVIVLMSGYGWVKELLFDLLEGKDDLWYAVLDALTYTLGAITGGLLSSWH